MATDELPDSLGEAALGRAIEAAGHAVLMTDTDGTITYVNPAFEEITGYTIEEAVGQTPSILNSGEHSDDYFRRLWETILAGDVWEEEIVNSRKDGEYYTAHQTIAPITTDGEIEGFVAIQTDITEQKQRQQELHRYERAIESTHDLICVLDQNGSYIFANTKYREYHDIVRDEDATVTLEEVFDGEEYRTIKHHVQRALQGETVRYQMTRTRASEERTFDIQYYPLQTDEGDSRGVVGTLRDVTELVERTKELEQSRNLLAQTEELAGMGGWEFDLATETLRWTAGTCRIHGVPDTYEPTLEEGIEFYHPEDREEIKEAVEKCRNEGISYEIEARLITASDQTRWVQTTGQQITRDGRQVLQGVIRDITGQKAREQRLMVLNRVLRHNLRNNLTTVMLYADLIESELEAFDELDASTADGLLENIRQHLEGGTDEPPAVASDLAEIERILERVTSFPPEATLRGARRIQENSQSLIEIGEKAHEYERTVGADQSTGAVAVRPLLADLAASYQAEFPDASIEVVGDGRAVHGNHDEIARIFGELLENALTHTDRDSPTVTVRIQSAADENVLVSIEDAGPGIPEMERQTIEMEEETALKHGSGIGLWLVNWLVTRQGGSLSIEDNEPRGTVVTVTLPAAGTE